MTPMPMPHEPPKPTVPLAIRKNALSQREKRRRRLLGEKRAAAEAKARSKRVKPSEK